MSLCAGGVVWFLFTMCTVSNPKGHTVHASLSTIYTVQLQCVLCLLCRKAPQRLGNREPWKHNDAQCGQKGEPGLFHSSHVSLQYELIWMVGFHSSERRKKNGSSCIWMENMSVICLYYKKIFLRNNIVISSLIRRSFCFIHHTMELNIENVNYENFNFSLF